MWTNFCIQFVVLLITGSDRERRKGGREERGTEGGKARGRKIRGGWKVDRKEGRKVRRVRRVDYCTVER